MIREIDESECVDGINNDCDRITDCDNCSSCELRSPCAGRPALSLTAFD